MSFDGEAAIVTGATAGIGRATCQILHARGARVVLVGRDESRGEQLVAEFGNQGAIWVPGDVRDEVTAAAALTAAEGFGGVRILVNNAGIDHTGPLLDVPLSEAREILEVNFVGALGMLQATARAMRGTGGSIVNVTSRLATIGAPKMGIYAASKGALLALTRSAALELAPLGIRVNAVAPGPTETELMREWFASQESPEAFRDDVAASIPQRRLARPQEVAHAIAFLASEDASHVTGATLAVDGGYTAQ